MGTLEKIIDRVAQQLDCNPEELTVDTHLADDLNADSLDMVELVMALEEEFGIEVPDEEAEKLATIRDIQQYLETKGAG